ncbi:aromatic ring-hydroxylating dioxygenase subunit alpha [Azospirillum cavernae]|uniref:Aromatic ring-hydroxylating dioxygenase subunit alpha n=1 Tax=Azospirillum cavernae TaxID=2320860 RepID=A0A418W2C8_9PROT|nr:aromatic ring-hydroxylating dioxygenase subunit alpha [Azospirillum cavernae]RJF84192.1 aromatic ring-hydroxylating dioxygenase subunit alpha [Azospirillum cavernae]
MAYLMNCWYVAAWNHEVTNERPLARTLLDRPVVLFRDATGTAQALFDRCPHRFAPLSLGTLDGDTLRCAYHGLEFNGAGACTRNPHGNGTIPKAAKVAAFPVVERHSLIWIWMGDPAKADPAAIPDFACLDPDSQHVGKRYLRVKANYLLETDNIMDLSHIQFLHASTLGSNAVAQATTEVKEDGNTVWSLRMTHGEIMPAFLYQAMGIESGIPVDRWIDVRWNAPANMLLLAGAVPGGRPRGEGRDTPTCHLFTPETARTTHYWFSISFPKAMGPFGAQLAEEQIEGLSVPFRTEDLPMLEAQQNAIGDADFWSLKPILLAGDAAGVRARRVLERLIAAEQTAQDAIAKAVPEAAGA